MLYNPNHVTRPLHTGLKSQMLSLCAQHSLTINFINEKCMYGATLNDGLIEDGNNSKILDYLSDIQGVS